MLAASLRTCWTPTGRSWSEPRGSDKREHGQELLRRVDAFAATRYEDRSTAVRQLVDFALRELHKRDALEAYQAGRVTLREFARSLGLDLWAAHDLLRAESVSIAQGDRAETSATLEAALRSIIST